MGKKLGRESDTKAASSSSKKIKVTSIRTKILQRVLPVALIPLVVLSVLTIAGILLLQRQPADAVGSAEAVLTDRAGDETGRTSERSARDLADYVDQWIKRVDRAGLDAVTANTIAQISNAAGRESFYNPSDEVLQIVLEGQTSRTQELALALRDELKTFEEDENVDVLIASAQGFTIGAISETAAFNQSEEEWFINARDNGYSFRSFVDDGESKPSFEIAIWTQTVSRNSGAGVIRVRVAMSNVQWILDEIASDNAVSISLVDTSASVLLADTSTEHLDSLMFDDTNLMTGDSGLNRELLTNGTMSDAETVTSASEVSQWMTNAPGITVDWLSQTNQPLDVADASLTEIQDVSNRVGQLRQILILGVLAFLLASMLLAFLAVRSAASNIIGPVKRLSDQAQAAANEGIPSIVEAAHTSKNLPELPDFDVESNDEISILAHSMNTMQEAAVDLAAGQAKLRRQNVSRTFVSLGRRNQNLLNRQLEFITELEQQEQDADALENLFRLDHLATRMRRNAENLLVLAGEQTPRRWGRPIAIRDVVRAAASEIADYPRVRIADLDEATVSGGLATDLSHLIAELLENAGSFSPPTTPIEVLGQHTSTHYRLAVVDQGIGMDPQALAQVNDRLKNPVDFADAPSAYLGLFVVGALAREMGVTVRLASADPTGEGRRRGTIAFVDLPISLLSQQEATPIELENRQDGVAHRAEGLDAAQQSPTAPNAPEDPTTAPAPMPAPVAETPRTELSTPTPAPVATETTSAGFPKRSRGTTSVPLTPQIMTPSAPQVPAAEPAAEPALAKAPESPTPLPSPAQAPQQATAMPTTEITAAGFPKRGSTVTPTPAPTAAPAPEAQTEPGAAPKRDAAAVSDSLRSIRAAVARGRATGQAQPTPAQPAPAQPAAVPDTNNSLTPPAVPIAPVPTQNPAPESIPQEPTDLAPESQPSHPGRTS